jgi:Skp family chaperone for outer membrane proteins
MKSSLVIVAFGLIVLAGPAYAQTPPAPKPAATPPAAAPQQPALAAQPPRPFPEGAKVALVNVQRIAVESAEGKGFTAKINALREKKEKELADKNTQLDAARKKLESSSSVLSEAARGAQQKEVERLQVDLQRLSQDAQAEVEELQRELQVDFQKKLLPVVEEVRAAKGLQLVLSMLDSGILAADMGLDITADVIKKLDSAAPAPAPTAPVKK